MDWMDGVAVPISGGRSSTSMRSDRVSATALDWASAFVGDNRGRTGGVPYGKRVAGRAASTLNHQVQVLKAAFRWAVRKGYLTRSPITDDSVLLKRAKRFDALRGKSVATSEETEQRPLRHAETAERAKGPLH
jgi:hypothetical protein